MSELQKSITINLSICTGCRACEMACSFHFSKTFSHNSSAIQVTRDNKNGEVTVLLSSTCDLCQTEDEPFCQMFCEPHAIRVGKQ